MKITILVIAVIAAGALAGFGPRWLEARQQTARDDSASCAVYRLGVSVKNYGGGTRNEWAELERERLAAGCSTYK